jgi:hypothetical protein
LLIITLSEQNLSTTDQYLTHYWPIENGTMIDEIGTAHMTQGSLTLFTLCPNSLLALNGGWTQVPPGIYFDAPEFTISTWVYPIDIGSYCRLIDFGNGPAFDNIILRLDSGSNYIPALNIVDDASNSIGECISTKALSNATWQLLTATFNGSGM